MKKLFMMVALVSALIFIGCEQSADSGTENDTENGGNDASELSLTIKNESSYELSDVKWSGKNFVSSEAGSPYLDVGASVKQNITDDESGYITFRYEISDGEIMFAEMALRTNELISSDRGTFTFTDNTIVKVVAAPVSLSNTGTLQTIIIQLGTELDNEKKEGE
jgi:uncharacterized lipoprotein NlpE involved in copper resistance